MHIFIVKIRFSVFPPALFYTSSEKSLKQIYQLLKYINKTDQLYKAIYGN